MSKGLDLMNSVFDWLDSSRFVITSKDYEKSSKTIEASTGTMNFKTDITLGVGCSRAVKKSKKEIDELVKKLKDKHEKTLPTSQEKWNHIYQTIRRPKEAIRVLDLTLMPPDAMAFYRPFHFQPFEGWGIYLYISKLLEYLEYLSKRFVILGVFTKENLAVMILFEVFHHEFFHHLVESAATTMEMVIAEMGQPQSIYSEYLGKRYKQPFQGNPDEPIEEALANAYAYNAFSFISRVRGGYVEGIVRVYQAVLEQYWKTQEPGYRDAGHYIKGGHVNGGALLLRKLAGKGTVPRIPLEKVAESVFPSGFAAFIGKPEVPTYLVGNQADLDQFYGLVPAPNEAYTNLFWPADTEKLDEFLKLRRAEEKAAKKPRKSQMTLF